MGELLTTESTDRLHPADRERGAINFIFAIFIAAALAFLFARVIPLMDASTGVESENQVSALLMATDPAVIEVDENGRERLAPTARDLLVTVLIKLEKQMYGSLRGRFCAAVFKELNSVLTTATPAVDALNRDCQVSLAAVEQVVQSQTSALGGTIKRSPYVVAYYKKDLTQIYALPAISTHASHSVTVAVAPSGISVIPPGNPTPTPTQSAPTPTPTPTEPEPTSTPFIGNNGEPNGSGNTQGGGTGGDPDPNF